MTDQTAGPTDSLWQRIAEALTAAAFECDGRCGLAARECYDAHPIILSAVSNGTTHVDAPVTAIADAVLAVVQPELDRLDRIRDAARLHRQQLINTSELYAVIEAMDATAATEATEPFIDRPFRSHRAALLAGVRDLSIPEQQTTGLVVQQYRADDGNQKWVFRCWGTDTCDGWLSLDHTSQQSAERARDRHVTEAHAEPPAPDAGPTVREAAADDRAHWGQRQWGGE